MKNVGSSSQIVRIIITRAEISEEIYRTSRMSKGTKPLSLCIVRYRGGKDSREGALTYDFAHLPSVFRKTNIYTHSTPMSMCLYFYVYVGF